MAPRKTAPPKAPKKMGRPSKKNTIPKKQLKLLYQTLSATDQQVADFFEVTLQTVTNWKQKDPEFFATIRDWKLTADGEIEATLRQKAMGFTGPDDKYYPPSDTAMIFWLKNRKPKEWRDKQDHEVTGDLNIKIVRFSGDD